MERRPSSSAAVRVVHGRFFSKGSRPWTSTQLWWCTSTVYLAATQRGRFQTSQRPKSSINTARWSTKPASSCNQTWDWKVEGCPSWKEPILESVALKFGKPQQENCSNMLKCIGRTWVRYHVTWYSCLLYCCITTDELNAIDCSYLNLLASRSNFSCLNPGWNAIVCPAILDVLRSWTAHQGCGCHLADRNSRKIDRRGWRKQHYNWSPGSGLWRSSNCLINCT